MKLKWPKRNGKRLIDHLFSVSPYDFAEGETRAVIEELLRLKQVEVGALDRAADMARRVDRIQEWLCWHRLWARQTTIKHPDGKEDVLDNALPAGQRPTFATPWTDHVNADGVADIRSIEHSFTEREVYWPISIIGNTVTLMHLLRQDMLRRYFNVPKDVDFQPRLKNVQKLLGQNTEFVIYDAGYRDAFSGESHKYVPDGYLIFVAATHWLVPIQNDDDDILMERIGVLHEEEKTLGEVEVDGQRMMRARRVVLPEVKHPECVVVAQAMP